jgi:hypothetical protein
MSDYEITKIDQSDNPFTYFAILLDYDPMTFKDVVKGKMVKMLWMMKLMPLRKTTYGR